jgi:outer membrane protein
MRLLSRTIFPVALLLAFTSIPALAQNKIATVDLKKVFDNYYKTKLATQAIQERADDLDKDYTSMATDLKKRSDQYQELLASANDQAVSSDERDKRRQSADDLFKQLQDSKAAIEQFERQAQVTISDQRQRMRDNILAEIKKTVADKAKTGGDSLVLDTAGQTIAGTPSIIYSDGTNDLTDAVLKQLNASAPPDLPDNAAPSVFMSTNTLPYSDTPGGTTAPANP